MWISYAKTDEFHYLETDDDGFGRYVAEYRATHGLGAASQCGASVVPPYDSWDNCAFVVHLFYDCLPTALRLFLMQSSSFLIHNSSFFV